MSERVSRRDFLKLALAVPIGVAAAAIEPSITNNAREVVTEKTGRPTGNAYFEELVKKEADGQDSTAFGESEVYICGIGPVVEEISFRALPSMLLDSNKSSGPREDIKNILVGDGKFLMDRKEVLVGALSSVFFGLTHNFTNATMTKFDTKKIPLEPTIGGFIYWYLQRTLGFFSNTTAHIAHNMVNYRDYKRAMKRFRGISKQL